MKLFFQTLIFTVFTTFFYAQQSFKLSKEFKDDFSFIPSGNVYVANNIISIQSFYILNHEVSNGEFKKFISEQSTENPEIEWVEVDNWITDFSDSDLKSMKENYFSSEAFNDYPVVNITYASAIKYCKWLEKKINSSIPSAMKVIVRLPTHEELIRSAIGDQQKAYYSWVKQDEINFMRNSKGQYMCNFKPINQSNLIIDENGALKSIAGFDYHLDGGFLLAKIKSYYPSKYGVYNLNGNAAEMIDQQGISVGGSWNDLGGQVRIQSKSSYNKSSAEVGFRPVFTVVNNKN